jgi:hypothetical protein
MSLPGPGRQQYFVIEALAAPLGLGICIEASLRDQVVNHRAIVHLLVVHEVLGDQAIINLRPGDRVRPGDAHYCAFDLFSIGHLVSLGCEVKTGVRP